MGIELLSLFGTLSGLITSCFQRYNDHKKMLVDLDVLKAKQEHELKMREMDAKLLEREYAARGNIAILEHEAKIDASDSALIMASMSADKKVFSEGITPDKAQAWVLILLDTIRALVRPILTGVITSAFTTITVIALLNVIKEGGLNNYAVAERGLGILGYSMNAVLTHYFGTRNKSSEANARRK